MKRKSLLLFVTAIIVFVFAFYSFRDHSPQVLTSKDFQEWRIEQKKHKKPNYGNPDEAMKWYYEQRAYPIGYIPENWKEEAMQHISQYNISGIYEKTTAALNWTQLGPGNIGGRIRSIAVHPTDPNTVYIGSVGGGVWKTVDGGLSWTALKDDMENLAVCALAIDPTNPNIIYAGTGEGFFNGDALRGEGIFKTTDAGATWNRLSSTNNSEFYYVNKLVIDNSTNIIYAATRKGLYKSTDGGASFTQLVGGSGQDVHCTDIEISYTSPSTIYTAFGIFNQGEIWRSTNGGTSFEFNFNQTDHGRIELATSTSNSTLVYASFMDLNTNGVGIIAYSTNSGNNWFSKTVPGPSYSGASNYAGTQGWYDNIVAIDPDNASVIYAGGIDFWKSTNGGDTWTQKTNWYQQAGAPQYVHADEHAIAFAPSNTNIMYLGNDGGVYKSLNKGELWTACNNNLSITQFYYGAVAPSGNNFYGGTQDNGTLGTSGSANWSEILGGDGGATEIDFNNPQNIYMEYVNLCFFKSTDGGASYFKAMNGIPAGPNLFDGTTDRTLFISPFSMDPNNSNTIVAGTYRVWRTSDGASNWSSISSDLTGDGAGSSGAKISTVIVAKGNSNVIYAGCSNGRVQVTTDGGANWNLRNSGLPNAYCTRIATDPNNPATAYATFSGYLSGDKVYKTSDYGQGWSNISSNLPNIPVNCVVVNPADNNNLFVGTDLGVFVTANDGGSWVQEINGMANVAVSDLDYRASDNKLFAATHGRSMYSTTVGGGGGQTYYLFYDDGTPTSGYYFSTAGNGSANRITPTVNGAQLIDMSIYIYSVASGIASYTPIVLQDNGGTPGSDYVTLLPKVASSVPGWDVTDLSPHNIIVNGDFYVGLIFDGINQPTYGYDPEDNGRAWDKVGGSWSSWNETYFMRATIQTLTSVSEIDSRIPDNFEVSQNYPNPFNPNTRFRYALPEGRNVSIIICDINGQKVTELVNNFQNAGTYEVTWNGKNDFGQQVASGTYIYSIKAGDYKVSKKMLLLK
ncbi:MAG: hypothetical protein A2V93_05420 [Ignavibacteria bacterium RBG_16_34_14]|nr:MAG: hypothetical protein A2V93_05420 [Ignavibacteria bacterium RBG_16_34_14]